MRNLLFFVAGLFCCLPALRAQTSYYKMLGQDNSWYIAGYHAIALSENSGKQAGSLGTAAQGEYRARFDSTVNSLSYKIFVHSPGSYVTIGPNMITCLVREDTIAQRVYVIPKDSTVERVVLDFSLNSGDSIFLTYPSNNYVLSSGYYKVDSIRYRTITAGSRKHLYLARRNAPINGVTGKRFYIEWIESVGAVHFPVNIIDQLTFSAGWKPQPNWFLACGKQELGSFVSCKLTNGIKIYHDSCSYKFAAQNYGGQIKTKSTCDYYVLYLAGGIDEENSKRTVRVFPQPLTSELNIQLDNDGVEIHSMYVLSGTGQQVPVRYTNQEEKIKCNLSELHSGIYILKIIMSDGSVVYTKITKE